MNEFAKLRFGLYIFIVGILLYLFHLGEALGASKTSKYLSWILKLGRVSVSLLFHCCLVFLLCLEKSSRSEKTFQTYIQELQLAQPEIQWSIQNYHFEEICAFALWKCQSVD